MPSTHDSLTLAFGYLGAVVAAVIALTGAVAFASPGGVQSGPAPAVAMCKLEANGNVNGCRNFDRYTRVVNGTLYLPVRCDDGARDCMLTVRGSTR